MSISDCFVLVVINISSALAKHCFKLVDVFPLKSSCFNTTSTSTLNKVTARVSPWFTPDSTLNSAVYSLFILSLALVLIRVNSISLISFAGTSYCAKYYIILFLYTESKACI
jgi:hypothetical protein